MHRGDNPAAAGQMGGYAVIEPAPALLVERGIWFIQEPDGSFLKLQARKRRAPALPGRQVAGLDISGAPECHSSQDSARIRPASPGLRPQPEMAAGSLVRFQPLPVADPVK